MGDEDRKGKMKEGSQIVIRFTSSGAVPVVRAGVFDKRCGRSNDRSSKRGSAEGGESSRGQRGGRQETKGNDRRGDRDTIEREIESQVTEEHIVWGKGAKGRDDAPQSKKAFRARWVFVLVLVDSAAVRLTTSRWRDAYMRKGLPLGDVG